MHACVGFSANVELKMTGLTALRTTGLVLNDLEVTPFLQPLLLSEEASVEKPDAEIFRRAFRNAYSDESITFSEGVHVGDELHW